MKKNDGSDEEELHQKHQRKEHIRQHAILIANLSASIVKQLREISEGMSKTDIINNFSEYSIEQINDALESALEDEYIERVEQDSAGPLYRAIIYNDE